MKVYSPLILALVGMALLVAPAWAAENIPANTIEIKKAAMRTSAMAAAALFFWIAVAASVAQVQSEQAANYSTYARNRAESETSAGNSALAGGVKGGAGGALFGAIIGGSKGAKRGAMLSGGAQSNQDRQARYQRYYDECMRSNTK